MWSSPLKPEHELVTIFVLVVLALVYFASREPDSTTASKTTIICVFQNTGEPPAAYLVGCDEAMGVIIPEELNRD